MTPAIFGWKGSANSGEVIDHGMMMMMILSRSRCRTITLLRVEGLQAYPYYGSGIAVVKKSLY